MRRPRVLDMGDTGVSTTTASVVGAKGMDRTVSVVCE